jgi:hypothetical protein
MDLGNPVILIVALVAGLSVLCLVCLGCSTVAGPGSAHHTARMRSTGTAMGSLVFLGGSSLAAGTAAPEEADGSPTGRPGPAWCLAC